MNTDLENLDLENYNKIIDLLDSFKTVVKKFDNKVLNVKLERALNECLPKDFGFISVETHYNSLIIQIKFHKRCVQEGKENNKGCWIYSKNDYFYLCYDSIVIDNKPVLLDNNRIKADNLINVFEKNINGLKKQVEIISNFDKEKVNQQKKELLKKIEYFNNSINYYFNEYRINLR